MKPSKNHRTNALFFDAIGHQRRQMICDILLERGHRGQVFDRLCQETELAPATLSFHLSQMDKGRLIKRQLLGSRTLIRIDYAHLQKHLYNYAVSCVNLVQG